MRLMFAVFNRIRKVSMAAIALGGAVLLAACNPQPLGTAGQLINTSRPVPVALLIPRGSATHGDNVLAQSLENSARLAIADLNGAKIDLRVYDTMGNPAQAASVATQAINDGARIILGPVYAEAANAVGIVAAKRNINVLAFSNNTSISGGNLFVLGTSFESNAQRLLAFAKQQGRNTIVMSSGNNAAGIAGRSAIQKAAASTGITVAQNISYELSQQGVINAVSPISTAVRSTGADAIVMTATSAGALPLLTQLLPEAGVKPETVQYIGLTRWDIPSQTLALPGLQGGWFAIPDPTISQQFRNRYQANYGTAPHPIGGLAYDGIAAIGALIATGNSDAVTATALTQSAGFTGSGGIFRLMPDGTNQRGLAVATIQDQKVVVIDAAPNTFGEAGL